MPVGDLQKCLYTGKIKSGITAILGTLDLHSHIRLNPVLKYLRNFLGKDKPHRIMEVGSGMGTLAFELPKILDIEQISYVGFDLNADAINNANEIAGKMNIDKSLRFVCADATTYTFADVTNRFDTIFLIDFLEHVKNPVAILQQLKSVLGEKGIIVVSVPTPNYKRVFGQDFHEKVGHLVDGFTSQGLKYLFNEIGATMIYSEYNTGLISNIGCALYYRFFLNIRYISFLKGLLLYPFRFLDLYNSERVSCSLFAVFELSEHVENEG